VGKGGEEEGGGVGRVALKGVSKYDYEKPRNVMRSPTEMKGRKAEKGNGEKNKARSPGK